MFDTEIFGFSTVASQRRIYVLQECLTLHTGAGSSRTYPGSGTDCQRYDAWTVRSLTVCISPFTEDCQNCLNRKLKRAEIEWISMTAISWTMPQPCHLFIYSINTVTKVCLCQQGLGNITQETVIAQPSIRPFILIDNDSVMMSVRCEWKEWFRMCISNYCHILCHKYWLWSQGHIDVAVNYFLNTYKKIKSFIFLCSLKACIYHSH